jgi:iron complex outermembrane receptor protein
MHRIFLSCFFITLCFISATTNAQHYQINDTILLPDVEIEGVAVFEKNAAFQRQMDTLSMQSMQSAGLTTLLSQHSGVFVKNSGPGTLSTVSFRGTAASHTLVLWNDFPVNAPMLGQVDFSQVPVFFIDQVGVLWGSASSAKRAGGLGGTVTLDNTMKLNKGLHLDLCQTAGSYGTFGSYATVDISKKKFQFRTRFFRKASRNDFEYENTASLPNARMKQQNADYSDYGLMQEIHISNRFGNFSLISWNQWNSRKLPPIMTNLERGGKPEEFQDDQFHRNVLGYLNAWQSGKIEIKAGYFIENQRYFLRTTSASAPAETVTLIDSKNKLESMHGQMKVTQSLLKNLSLFGRMQWNRDKVVSNNYSDTKTRTQSSISMGATWVVNSFLSTELIVNQDMADNNNLGLNPSFTVYYKIPSRQTLNISGGINKNYRLPSMNDLFWYPGGNESLQAEKGITTDLSIQWQPRAGNFHSEMDIDVFFSVISDWIQWRPTEYRYWEPLNIARVFARGTEFHFRTEGKVYGTSISLSGNYVFTITTDESQVAKLENSSGRQLIYIPRHHANMSLSSAYKGYSFTYTIEFTGRRTTSPNGEDLYTGVLPAYVLHHIALGKKIKKFESEIRVNNLLNKSYQAVLWRAMPGRNAEILIRYQL